MLPFLRKRSIPTGPHEFGAEIEIERPASEVYPLLDFADPSNAKRELGDKVHAIAGAAGRFELTVSALPDAVFALAVTAEQVGREYAFSCVSTPTFGNVARSYERYVMEDLGDGCCKLILTNTVEFGGKLTEDEYQLEAMMLTFSCFSALAKLKIHAEQGAEAVKKLEREQLAGLEDFECGLD